MRLSSLALLLAKNGGTANFPVAASTHTFDGYCKYFSGHEQSLIAYNWRQDTIGNSLILNDLVCSAGTIHRHAGSAWEAQIKQIKSRRLSNLIV